jgi:hypothetical protein
MKISFQLEALLQKTPGNVIHNMTDAQFTVYNTLIKQKSAMSEELHLLMINDGNL